jgi:hypothetical protein
MKKNICLNLYQVQVSPINKKLFTYPYGSNNRTQNIIHNCLHYKQDKLNLTSRVGHGSGVTRVRSVNETQSQVRRLVVETVISFGKKERVETVIWTDPSIYWLVDGPAVR